MANNKPVGAVIGLDILEKLQLETVLRKALKEYKAGKTKKYRYKRRYGRTPQGNRRDGLIKNA
ncbi:hypothetical protein A3C26_02475 [Candidatus Daviesbacteria bacterium RIFCSPHIGHO2_02_FULL_39_12]|uniref:Uncharacterized protein n=2 Tax=Candidatus Daviesiibacteriota TaxID=1752718 RepID=A0A1F5J9S2_9BACT|nr:MAG: hypothetical protein A3C26_02475 [Candidatus Daviesbacteria bacterium RIFCSPHIGHO2_02_FULL_39_12]OGE71477.1 MAG: hypothetical protein A3H40_03040 [Candidatus Daviesbacteria bacterium RIFCSPLOWO2_02_FULL_38_15]